jgi:hypothetical protein
MSSAAPAIASSISRRNPSWLRAASAEASAMSLLDVTAYRSPSAAARRRSSSGVVVSGSLVTRISV